MMPDSNAIEWRWRLARQYWAIGYLLEDGDLGVLDDGGYAWNDTVSVKSRPHTIGMRTCDRFRTALS